MTAGGRRERLPDRAFPPSGAPAGRYTREGKREHRDRQKRRTDAVTRVAACAAALRLWGRAVAHDQDEHDDYERAPPSDGRRLSVPVADSDQKTRNAASNDGNEEKERDPRDNWHVNSIGPPTPSRERRRSRPLGRVGLLLVAQTDNAPWTGS